MYRFDLTEFLYYLFQAGLISAPAGADEDREMLADEGQETLADNSFPVLHYPVRMTELFPPRKSGHL